MAARLVSQLDISHLRYGIPEKGWQWFVNGHLQKEIKWFAQGGITKCRFFLHNPGFTPLPSGGMTFQFDQWVARTKTWNNISPQRHAELRAEFPNAIRPIVQAGHEVICYLGALRWVDPVLDPWNGHAWLGGTVYDDYDFRILAQPGKWDKWNARVQDSMAPALAAGCAIGFDTLSQITTVHPAYNIVRTIESLGARCYVEPSPLIWKNDEFGCWYAQRKIDMFKDLSSDLLSLYAKKFGAAEMIMLNSPYAKSKSSETSRIRKTLAYGSNYTGCFRVYGYGTIKGAADLGVKCSDLLK
jgi:hypothetical protein